MRELYVSTDIEADGPIPGPHSLLSFGSAIFLPDHTVLGTFSAVLTTLPDATGHPDTMAWWDQHPDAWAANRLNPEDPAVALPRYVAWLASFEGRPVFVGYPAAYDFLFLYWYLLRFFGHSPFSHSALDIKTLASAVLDLPYRAATKRRFPKAWFRGLPHTHCPLDDALEQGHLFCELWARRPPSARHVPVTTPNLPSLGTLHLPRL